MNMQTEIEAKLSHGLAPMHLHVVNESSQHNVPAGSESHFKVVVVSALFEGKMPIARHRMINALLAEELNGKIHALALHTYTEGEWQKTSGSAPMSPPCLGGSKA